MLAVTSITALNQGSDLARWHVRQIYAAAPKEAELKVMEAVPISAPSRSSALLGIASLTVRILRVRRPRNALTGTVAAE